MAKQLGLAGFSVIRSSCVSDEKENAAMAFLLQSLSLPHYAARAGPDVFRRSDVNKFLENSKNADLMWVDKDMRVCILRKRETTSAEKFAKSLFGHRNSGISAGLVGTNTVKIYTGTKRNHSELVKKILGNVAGKEGLFFKRD